MSKLSAESSYQDLITKINNLSNNYNQVNAELSYLKQRVDEGIDMGTDWVTVNEAAEIEGVTRKTIFNRLKPNAKNGYNLKFVKRKAGIVLILRTILQRA